MGNVSSLMRKKQAEQDYIRNDTVIKIWITQ